MGITDIFTLLTGVALFLYGMALMGDGLKMVAGSKLEIILYKLSSTPLKGILLGTGVTAVIQSSSATSVMVVGFVNSGMMKLRQAIGVVMGSIIGTSITGWIICLSYLGGGESSGWVEIFSTETLTAIIAVVGIILRMFSSKPSRRHLGDIFMGFAVLMFGMIAMSGSVSGLRTDPTFISLMTTFSNPIVGILVGIVFTSILQSASAAVGILQALSITGAITFDVSFSLVMGIAIGAAVPVLLSALGANTDGKRTALSYLVVTVIGVALFCAIFYPLNHFVSFPFMTREMNAFSIALLNSVFRIINIILVAPFLAGIERICAFLAKEKSAAAEDLRDMDRLEERFLQHPALAVEQSRLTVNSMAERSMNNLYDAFALIGNYSEDGYDAVERVEDIIDRYEDKIGTYLMNITGKELNQDQSEAVSKYLHTINDFERMSDHALNIAECAKEISEKGIAFSSEASHELSVLIAAVTEVVNLAVKAFVGNDLALAYRVEPLEELIDDLCDEMKLHHIERLQKGKCTLNHGFVFNDLLTNFERVSDHCSNIAVAMIELEADSFDTHEYLNSLSALHTESFDSYYREYSQRFSIKG
ncbi:MAG: Na/Pi cotransporter family protein [Bacillota bacterium]|nr:Na/Pi cotransporter family protein [Bacillota bacterium]